MKGRSMVGLGVAEHFVVEEGDLGLGAFRWMGRSGSRRGAALRGARGVGMLVQREASATILKVSEAFELIWVVVTPPLSKISLVFAVAYCPPEWRLDEFAFFLSGLSGDIVEMSSVGPIYLMADWNLGNEGRRRVFEEWCGQEGLVSLVPQEWTRVGISLDRISYSITDAIVCSIADSSRVAQAQVLQGEDLGGTDHRPIVGDW